MPKKVFISYVDDEAEFPQNGWRTSFIERVISLVNKPLNVLRWNDGVEIEFAHMHDGLDHDGGLLQTLQARIHEAKVFVVLLSESYLLKPWCIVELASFLDTHYNKQVDQITSVRPDLGRCIWVPLFPRHLARLEELYELSIAQAARGFAGVRREEGFADLVRTSPELQGLLRDWHLAYAPTLFRIRNNVLWKQLKSFAAGELVSNGGPFATLTTKVADEIVKYWKSSEAIEKSNSDRRSSALYASQRLAPTSTTEADSAATLLRKRTIWIEQLASDKVKASLVNKLNADPSYAGIDPRFYPHREFKELVEWSLREKQALPDVLATLSSNAEIDQFTIDQRDRDIEDQKSEWIKARKLSPFLQHLPEKPPLLQQHLLLVEPPAFSPADYRGFEKVPLPLRLNDEGMLVGATHEQEQRFKELFVGKGGT